MGETGREGGRSERGGQEHDIERGREGEREGRVREGGEGT